MALKKLFSFLAFLTLSACAHPPRPSTPPPPPPQDEWTPLTWEERHDVMTFAVLPNMARTFQAFEGSPAPDLACTSCHGADAEAVAYRMPHGLPPLDPQHLPSAADPDPKTARIARFMIDEVTPQMQRIVEAPVTCFTCHPATEATNAH